MKNSPSTKKRESINEKTIFGREVNFKEIGGTLVQSIGKLDKSRTPIFEGHIIREYSNDNEEYSDFLVCYNVSECAFTAYLIDVEDYGSYHLSSFDEPEIEIVGHFFTDKDLLKDFDVSRIDEGLAKVSENC